MSLNRLIPQLEYNKLKNHHTLSFNSCHILEGNFLLHSGREFGGLNLIDVCLKSYKKNSNVVL